MAKFFLIYIIGMCVAVVKCTKVVNIDSSISISQKADDGTTTYLEDRPVQVTLEVPDTLADYTPHSIDSLLAVDDAIEKFHFQYSGSPMMEKDHQQYEKISLHLDLQLEEKLAKIFSTTATWKMAMNAARKEGEDIVQLNASPDIYLWRNFIKPEECSFLINQFEIYHRDRTRDNPRKWCFFGEDSKALFDKHSSQSNIDATVLYKDNLSRQCANDSRVDSAFSKNISFSSTVCVPSGDNMFVDFITARLQKRAGLSPFRAFHSQIIKYNPPSTAYSPHMDCHGRANDRHVTFVAYLKSIPAPYGQTVFPELNLNVTADAGSALFFSNVKGTESICDPRTVHMSSPMPEDAQSDIGPKYILQKWYHGRSFIPKMEEKEMVLCDAGANCREYFSPPSTKTANSLVREGKQFLKAGKIDEALNSFSKAITVSPRHTLAHLNLSGNLFKYGRMEDAVRAFEDALNAGVLFRHQASRSFMTLSRLMASKVLQLQL